MIFSDSRTAGILNREMFMRLLLLLITLSNHPISEH